MKIGLFLASRSDETGGIQAFVSHVSRELVKFGQEVTVFGPEFQKPMIYDFPKYIPVSKTFHVHTKSGFRPTVNLPTGKNKPRGLDILQMHEPYIPFATGALPFTLDAKIKIASFHTGWQSSGVWIKTVETSLPFLKPFFSNYYDGVTYASEFVKRNWSVLFDIKHLQAIIPYGVEAVSHRERERVSRSEYCFWLD